MSNTSNPVVANTVVIGANVKTFVNKYRMCVQKTATAILELAGVVHSAKKELTKTDFSAFRREIGAGSSKDSFIKKLCVIAENCGRFSSIEKQLPASYTTLYSLAKMDKSTFLKVLDAQVICPQMTALNLSKFITNRAVTARVKMRYSPVKQCVLYTLQLHDIANDVAFTITEQISQICKKHGVLIDIVIDDTVATRAERAQNQCFGLQEAA